MAKVLDHVLEVNEFELQLRYYLHFQTHILGKSMKPFNHLAMDEIISFLFFLQGLLWY